MLIQLKSEAAELIAKAAGANKEVALNSLETPKEAFGDLSSRIAFLLAKEMKKSPLEIAKEIANKIKPSRSFEKIEATGPYVNFFFSQEAFRSILQQILKDKECFGSGKKLPGKTIIEFPSVNPNKPWHIGHLRNAILGDSVARILEFSGTEVERLDYIDDLGLQVAQSLWGFLHLGHKPHGKFDLWLGTQYVEVAKKFEKEKNLEADVRTVLKQMEEGDNEVAKIGRWLAEECVRAQYQTAFAFNIMHDALIFESDIVRTVFSEGIESLKKSGAITHETEGKNAGCWVVKLPKEFEEEFGEMRDADKILIRSDNTAVYTGKDVIFHLWKFGKLRNEFSYEPFIEQPNGKIAFKTSGKGKKMKFGKASRVINVIGMEQRYPQAVISEVLKKLGYEKEAAGMIHLAYEHVWLPGEKFSGRAGTWVGYTADELLEEARQRVKEKITIEASDEEKKKIADIVGASAIKFSFLKTVAEKKITFKWEEALSMEGDSGPYVQYSFVRSKGILGKTTEKSSIGKYEFNPEEKMLIRAFAEFGEIAQRCNKEFAPHHLCQYLLSLAGHFNSFYRVSPVLKAEKEEERRTRLAIVQASSIVLGSGLGLLGIESPEKM